MNPHRWGPTCRTVRGYTLVEVLVVVSLLGLLLALGVPSFVALSQRQRAASEINSLVGDLQFARSEAIKRGVPVSVCTSSNGRVCLGASTWHSGWIVFADPERSGSASSTEAVLRARPGWNNGDSLVAEPAMAAVTFGREGFAANLPAGVVTLPLRSAATPSTPGRCLTLNRVGRQTVQPHGTGTCL